MAAMAPLGFWIGALQGGAMTAHLRWIFGTNTILAGVVCVATYFSIPPLSPVAASLNSTAPTLRDLDYKGAVCFSIASTCLLLGLTQGPVVQ